MKHFTIAFTLLFCALFCSIPSVYANGGPIAAEELEFDWQAGVSLIENEILSSMIEYVGKKKWTEAWYHLQLYRTLGSDENAEVAMQEMLKDKNKDGALAVIKLTKASLVNPFKSPITGTRQVKKAFLRVIQSAGKKWGCKSAVMTTFLNIFSLEKMSVPEMTAVAELRIAIDKEITITATSLENVLYSIFEHGNINVTPLDGRPDYTVPTEYDGQAQ